MRELGFPCASAPTQLAPAVSHSQCEAMNLQHAPPPKHKRQKKEEKDEIHHW